VRDYLGPQLQAEKLDHVKLIIWDHNRDIMVERASVILDDPEAAGYVWGTGFHWYGGDHFDNVQKLHDAFPDKQLIFTEGCQEGGPHFGSWDLGERYARSVINDLNRWTVAWIDWNLLLDEQGGPNHVGNYCSAPILADTAAGKIHYQSSYYYLGHFSRFIPRGSIRIHSKNSSSDLEVLAVRNPSGEIVVVVMNTADTEINFALDHKTGTTDIFIPARAIITLTISEYQHQS